MVVIKGKRPPEPDDEDEDDKQVNKPASDIYGNMADMFQSDDRDRTRESAFVPRSMIFEDGNGKNDKNAQPKYAEELLHMTFFHGTKFKFFEDSIDLMPSHMHSIGETKIPKLANAYIDNPSLWRQYNTGHMTRTYPAGKRVDSSNYNPVFAWGMGCQLVALNFQTNDSNLFLNDGRFRQNGGCGYVLKPPSLSGGKKRDSMKIQIRVLSGSCLPNFLSLGFREATT